MIVCGYLSFLGVSLRHRERPMDDETQIKQSSQSKVDAGRDKERKLERRRSPQKEEDKKGRGPIEPDKFRANDLQAIFRSLNQEDLFLVGRLMQRITLGCSDETKQKISDILSEDTEISSKLKTEKSIQKQIIRDVESLDTQQLHLIQSYTGALLKGENPCSCQKNSSMPAKPLWSERTTGREVTPIDWIKMHYGRWDGDEWYADGLTQADISGSDRKLYHAYIARTRRLPEENLNLPKESRSIEPDPQKALEKRRQAAREYMRRRQSETKNDKS